MWSAHTGTPGIQYQLPAAARRGRTRASSRSSARSSWPRRVPAEMFGLGGDQGRAGGRRSTPTSRSLDLDAPWTITNDGVLSRCGWTPYDGRERQRRGSSAPSLRGTEVYADGVVVGEPGGGRMATAHCRGDRGQLGETLTMKFGLLLPHFGEYADKDKLLDGSKLAEDFGFDSVWVRDHLVFEPHGEMEKPNRTFYDALTTLTAIGAVTERIELGTGSLIPFRHPLEVALIGRHDDAARRPARDPRLRRRHVRPRVRGDRHGATRDQALAPRQEHARRSCSKVWHRERRRLQRRLLLVRGRHDRAQAGRRPGAVLVLRQHAARRRAARSSTATAGCPGGSRSRTFARARRQDARAVRGRGPHADRRA